MSQCNYSLVEWSMGKDSGYWIVLVKGGKDQPCPGGRWSRSEGKWCLLYQQSHDWWDSNPRLFEPQSKALTATLQGPVQWFFLWFFSETKTSWLYFLCPTALKPKFAESAEIQKLSEHFLMVNVQVRCSSICLVHESFVWGWRTCHKIENGVCYVHGVKRCWSMQSSHFCW